MAADGQDGPVDDPSSENEGRPSVPEDIASRPRSRPDQGSWASDNVPVILLALIVLVLMIAGGMSNDNVTCPGGASSCGYP
ncbi:hypothetical protein GCM10010381_58680 [Streptomyces xantholiticus]|nr:hypothetical protein GCM10010381_58680 [Streptomyces xantholiticus]